MARYVRLQDGIPVEFRDLAEAPPAHKAGMWTPVVEQASPSHAVGETTVRSEGLVNGEWVISYEVVALPEATLIDMIKAVDPAASIESVRVLRKDGGKTGEWLRPADRP